jgi:DNA-binding response OmpR family regulator
MAKDNGQKAGKRILLVDDDAEIVESLRLALEANGYTVLVARDGNQGLALSERENPDLVILDMMMPKAAGTKPTPRCLASTTISANPSRWTG